MKLQPGELRTLAAAASPQAWNRTMDTIREVRGGYLPPDWGDRVIKSGLFRRTRAAWPMVHKMNHSPRTSRFDAVSASAASDRTEQEAVANWPPAS